MKMNDEMKMKLFTELVVVFHILVHNVWAGIRFLNFISFVSAAMALGTLR